MNQPQTFVIAGASLAGAKAAETLREQGFDGRIVLVGEEAELPYERPPLSKGYLLGNDDKDVIYLHDRPWYDQHGIELRLGVKATRIDRDAHRLELADGQQLGYDKLLLTTGASVRRLDVAGADLDGVCYLRTVGDSERLREAINDGGQVVVVGAGWIGLEAAAAARSYGAQVTVVEPAQTPLFGALGPELGGFFADLHRGKGVQFRFGEGVTGLLGKAGKVRAVVTSSGQQLPADTVIVGVGVTPNVDLARDAGLEIDNGVTVDASLRSSDPDIYAAGDLANIPSPLFGQRLRVEHWANALAGGPAAARAMLGHHIVYDKVPYFFSDQYELGMEYAGHAAPGSYHRIVYRGERDSGEFIAFWLTHSRVLAGMNVNIWDVTEHIQALIRARQPVDPAQLTDPNLPLDQLLSH